MILGLRILVVHRREMENQRLTALKLWEKVVTCGGHFLYIYERERKIRRLTALNLRAGVQDMIFIAIEGKSHE